MKAIELRDLDLPGLDRKLAELREELFNLRFQQATRQLTNTDRLRQVRKDIARVLTCQAELASGLERQQTQIEEKEAE
jgi:large subunit ribosomal protein L29